MPDRFTVADVLDDSVRVNAAAKAALVAFRRAKPWQGDHAERLVKFQALHQGLAEAYGITTALEFRGEEVVGGHGDGAFVPPNNVIILVRKLSVVTYLHCFCRARGMDKRAACRWSLSIFRRIFPVSFANCQAVGPFLIRD